MNGEGSLEEFLSSVLDPKKTLTIHVIPQSHIDLAWNWRWADTVKMIHDTLEGHASILEGNPDATYAQSQIHVYWLTEEYFPSLFKRIKKLVKQGRWEIVGGEWVETDHHIPSGESLVRHFLTGQTYLRERFGKQAQTGWAPDAFGHSPNLPQIMLKSGIQAFIFKRPREKFMKLPEVPFWWIGLDGSKILSLRVNNKGKGLPRVSEGRVLPPAMNEVTYLQGEFEKLGLHNLWGPLGVGDVGGVNEYPAAIKKKTWSLICSTPSRFIEETKKEMGKLPEVKGELDGINVGTYTTHMDMKEGNRKVENQLFITEFLASLAMIYGQPYPEEELKELWRRFLFNHFHDIIAGTSIPEVHVESGHDFFEVVSGGEDLERRSLWFLTGKIDTNGSGKPIVVFNPLSWERTDLVETEVDKIEDAEALEIVDIDGNTSPVQVLEQRRFQGWKRQRILFVAKNVPSLGYKAMWLRPAERAAKKRAIHRNIAENEYFRIVGDSKTGYVSSILDKRHNKEIIEPGKAACRWLIFEEGLYVQDYDQDMRAWNFGLTGHVDEAEKTMVPTLTEEGPLRTTLCMEHKFGNSQFKQRAHIYDELPRIDVTASVQWEEIEKLARLDFPFNISAAKLMAEIPFGVLKKETNGSEFAAQKWVDISNEAEGIALLNNARYGHSAEGNSVRISVLRCSTQPDPRSDRGKYEFKYAIYPHSGSWDEADIHRRGCEFNIPLIGVEATVHEGDMPPQFSLASVDSHKIVISALKKAEKSDELILRLYETTGTALTSKIRFAAEWQKSNLKETNLIEDQTSAFSATNGEFNVRWSPFEIKTFQIKPPTGTKQTTKR